MGTSICCQGSEIKGKQILITYSYCQEPTTTQSPQNFSTYLRKRQESQTKANTIEEEKISGEKTPEIRGPILSRLVQRKIKSYSESNLFKIPNSLS